jgi:hypothetical protein
LVGCDNDLTSSGTQVVEGVEELLLRSLLTGQELNVVDEKDVRRTVFAAELIASALAEGSNEVVGKVFTGEVEDTAASLRGAMPDGMEEVCLACAYRAIEEKGIVQLTRLVSDGQGAGRGEAIAVADNEALEGKLVVEWDFGTGTGNDGLLRGMGALEKGGAGAHTNGVGPGAQLKAYVDWSADDGG